MATISSRSALGDITKLQNIPKKVALVDIGAKVEILYCFLLHECKCALRWSQGKRLLRSYTWMLTWRTMATPLLTGSYFPSCHRLSSCLRRNFPIGVADIDEKDLENPQLCAEYTQDVYAYLRLNTFKFLIETCSGYF